MQFLNPSSFEYHESVKYSPFDHSLGYILPFRLGGSVNTSEEDEDFFNYSINH